MNNSLKFVKLSNPLLIRSNTFCISDSNFFFLGNFDFCLKMLSFSSILVFTFIFLCSYFSIFCWISISFYFFSFPLSLDFLLPFLLFVSFFLLFFGSFPSSLKASRFIYRIIININLKGQWWFIWHKRYSTSITLA